MKKFITVLTALLLLVCLCSVALATTYVQATSAVCIRTGPSTSYSQVGTLGRGKKLPYLGTSSNGNWYKVEYDGKTCYVSAGYAIKVPSSSGESTGPNYKNAKATSSVHVRKGAGLDYSVLTTISKGDVVAYLRANKKDSRGVTWYKVKTAKGEGWISSKYAKLTDDGSDTGDERLVTATKGSTRIRDDADINAEALGTLGRGKSLKFLGGVQNDARGVDWYEVKYKGGSAWVSSKYTSLHK